LVVAVGAHIAVAVRQNGAALRPAVNLNASIKLKKTILID
jgi:hypothetical protein